MGPDRAAALDAARALLRQAEQRVGVTSHNPEPITTTTRTGGLELLLPTSLPAAAACTITGSTSLLLMALAAAQTSKHWIAFVGMPAVGLLAADEAGIDLRRVAHIPDVAGNGPAVVAALLDGVDHVVVGPACLLARADRRRLLARARERGTTLIATSPWEGATLTLEVQRTVWSGVDRGDFWVREAHWDVLRHSKVDGPGRRFTIHRAPDGELTVEETAHGLRLVTGAA